MTPEWFKKMSLDKKIHYLAQLILPQINDDENMQRLYNYIWRGTDLYIE